MANIEEKVEKAVEPVIVELGYSLYDVEYAKEGQDYFLRIFIDNEKGISLEDCEKVTNAINDILDKEDYIKERIFLRSFFSWNRKNFKKRKTFRRKYWKNSRDKII